MTIDRPQLCTFRATKTYVVCMYVCMHACMHAFACTLSCIYLHVNLPCNSTHVRIHAHIHKNTSTFLHFSYKCTSPTYTRSHIHFPPHVNFSQPCVRVLFAKTKNARVYTNVTFTCCMWQSILQPALILFLAQKVWPSFIRVCVCMHHACMYAHVCTYAHVWHAY